MWRFGRFGYQRKIKWAWMPLDIRLLQQRMGGKRK